MKPLASSLRARQLSGYTCSSCTRQLRRQRRNYGTSSPRSPEVFDVVCVGGGPAGLSLLAALRANPITSFLKIALIESQSLTPLRSYAPSPTAYSNRCSSLTPNSVRFLKDIGAWEHVRAERVQGYGRMRIWDGVSGASIGFESESSGDGEEGVVAYMNENLNLTSALVKRVDGLGGVEVLDEQKVQDIKLGEDTEEGDFSSWPVVRTSEGKEVAARLLVGADGANSPVRTFSGIESRGWDYGRVGVVATLKMEGSGWGGEGAKIAYQRFLPTGPVACLPLPGDFSTLVWSTTPELANRLKGMSQGNFVSMVNAAFRLSPVDLSYLHDLKGGQADEVAWRVQHTPFEPEQVPMKVTSVQEGTIASFPLKLRHADTYIGERIALVGDAAHTTHPLAGQGLNQGQGDVESLARSITYSIEHGMDIGTRMSLESYNSERCTSYGAA
ncbi:hypothetical protein G7Y89_g13632 [Cudoniella acicularis]|uniref:FAD-binding domain-containing protein n=1 Tax=Cudoniella acicularis TaxID=354080 RepID=A0A8H4VY19_9HELO|nr:hypothetical protein G7Y89_g13632 [Cudoniella acicularis]